MEEKNILHIIRRRKNNWVFHILLWNCLLKHVIEGKVEGKRRRGRRRNDILEGLKEKRRQFNLKEETLDRTVRRARFGRGYGPVARQATQCSSDLWNGILSSVRNFVKYNVHLLHNFLQYMPQCMQCKQRSPKPKILL
jgi:hypothetical protein